jgi:hypothetical protein
MKPCEFDVVLYFYDEMDPADRARATAHVRRCSDCRQRLEELGAIRSALASRPPVDAPPASDWSGFMRRLDEAVKNRGTREPNLETWEPNPGTREPGTREPRYLRHVAALAAMVALVTIGVLTAARFRSASPMPIAATTSGPVETSPETNGMPALRTPEQAFREVSLEHLERSKLVVLGLATRDARETSSADWQYERTLAGTLLPDTRLYRLAAQDRGVSDVARVMRDLETVLLEASLSDNSDREALGRVQRLISKRDLVVKMQVMAGSSGL